MISNHDFYKIYHQRSLNQQISLKHNKNKKNYSNKKKNIKTNEIGCDMIVI